MAETDSDGPSGGVAPQMMAWTVLVAGLCVVAFGCLLILIGRTEQLALVQLAFGVGSTFVAWGMGIKVDLLKILQGVTGAKSGS